MTVQCTQCTGSHNYRVLSGSISDLHKKWGPMLDLYRKCGPVLGVCYREKWRWTKWERTGSYFSLVLLGRGWRGRGYSSKGSMIVMCRVSSVKESAGHRDKLPACCWLSLYRKSLEGSPCVQVYLPWWCSGGRLDPKKTTAENESAFWDPKKTTAKKEAVS